MPVCQVIITEDRPNYFWSGLLFSNFHPNSIQLQTEVKSNSCRFRVTSRHGRVLIWNQARAVFLWGHRSSQHPALTEEKDRRQKYSVTCFYVIHNPQCTLCVCTCAVAADPAAPNCFSAARCAVSSSFLSLFLRSNTAVSPSPDILQILGQHPLVLRWTNQSRCRTSPSPLPCDF